MLQHDEDLISLSLRLRSTCYYFPLQPADFTNCGFIYTIEEACTYLYMSRITRTSTVSNPSFRTSQQTYRCETEPAYLIFV